MALNYIDRMGSRGRLGRLNGYEDTYQNTPWKRAVSVPSGGSEDNAVRTASFAPRSAELQSGDASVAPVDPAAERGPQLEAAYAAYAPFQEYVEQRHQNGTAFMPIQSPRMTFREDRDADGYYTSRNLDIDYSGVPEAARGLFQMYAAPIQGRLGQDMADENRIRRNVRDSTPFTMGQQARVRETYSIAPGQTIPDSNNPNWNPGIGGVGFGGTANQQYGGGLVGGSFSSAAGAGTLGNVGLGQTFIDPLTGRTHLAEARFPGSYGPQLNTQYEMVYDPIYFGSLPLTGQYYGLR